MTTVSIALCTYNGECFLSAQLKSLADQSMQPSELVICDDQSSDRTEEIILSFAEAAPFEVRYFRNDRRLGYSKNFMKAVDLCRGDLIACCDQDDVWYPDKLELSTAPFSDERVLLTYHQVDLINDAGKYIRSYGDRFPGTSLVAPLTGSPWVFGMGFTIVIRDTLKVGVELSELTFDQNIPDKPVSHDQWYTFIASVLGHIAYIDRSLAGYRQHSANVVGVMEKLGADARNLAEAVVYQADEFERCSRACFTRAQILRLLAEDLAPPLRVRALAGAERYAALHKMFSLRNEMYRSPSVTKKWDLIRHLYLASGYENNKPWSFGRKALIKDLLLSYVKPHRGQLQVMEGRH
jgi:glycosyltransferase involved in cell wall biosynthesis